jgi:hypothetical protein
MLGQALDVMDEEWVVIFWQGFDERMERMKRMKIGDWCRSNN